MVKPKERKYYWDTPIISGNPLTGAGSRGPRAPFLQPARDIAVTAITFAAVLALKPRSLN